MKKSNKIVKKTRKTTKTDKDTKKRVKATLKRRLTRKRKSVNQKGGIMTQTLIGQGASGCVYKPSLKCDVSDEDIKYVGKISKVVKESVAKDEKAMFSYIDKLDPENMFHIGLLRDCDIQKEDLSEIKSKGECKIFPTDEEKKSDTKNYKLLIFKDGGKELYEYFRNLESYVNRKHKEYPGDIFKECINFLMAFMNLINGIKTMVGAKILHNDIKEENVVYDMKENVLRFIDFGLSINYKYKSAYDAKKKLDGYTHLFYGNYFAYPPEIITIDFKVFSYFTKERQIPKLRKFMLSRLNDFNNNNFKSNYMMRRKIIQYYSELINRIYRKYNNNIENAYLIYVITIFNKYDIYSLSLILKNMIDVYISLMGGEEAIDIRLEQIIKNLDIYMLNTLNPRATKRWNIEKAAGFYKSSVYDLCAEYVN